MDPNNQNTLPPVPGNTGPQVTGAPVAPQASAPPPKPKRFTLRVILLIAGIVFVLFIALLVVLGLTGSKDNGKSTDDKNKSSETGQMEVKNPDKQTATEPVPITNDCFEVTTLAKSVYITNAQCLVRMAMDDAEDFPYFNTQAYAEDSTPEQFINEMKKVAKEGDPFIVKDVTVDGKPAKEVIHKNGHLTYKTVLVDVSKDNYRSNNKDMKLVDINGYYYNQYFVDMFDKTLATLKWK